MITAIYIGVDRIDLYKDDNIVINNSVAKSEDITKVFTDVSNSFSVPASDNNNKIFKHYYNSDVLDGFDARKNVDAVIELNGINYKVGKIKLNKVILKGNKPSSYSIDFIGNLIALKDILKDDKLTDLDLSAHDFIIDIANTTTKLTTSGDTIMSLFADKRYVYDTVNTIATTDTLVNIAYNGTSVDNGISYTEPKISIKNLRVIEAIESQYNLTFSRDFLGLNEFESLFLLLSNKDKAYSFKALILGATTDPTYQLFGDYILATGIGTPTERETTSLVFGVTPTDLDIEYSMYIESDGVEIGRLPNVKGVQNLSLDVADLYNAGGLENVWFYVESSESITYSSNIYRHTPTTFYLSTSSVAVQPLTAKISNLIPSIKTIDYLKGLFQLFKLVAIPQKDGSIYVNTLERYYTNGNLYNVSEYIDYNKTDVSAGKLLNEINYKFEDATTILAKKFKEVNGVGYGDLELSILDDNGDLISGQSQEYKVPFEQVVYEKVYDIGVSSLDTSFQYALLTDDNITPVDIKAHLHYNYSGGVTAPIKIINELGVAVSVSNINFPIHTNGLVLPLVSTTFGNEFNEFDGNLITNTLYSNHHQKYITDVFNERKRSYTFKAKNVPNQIVLNLNLNDALQIKEKYYRIESYNINIIKNEIDFNLINAIDLDLTPYTSTSLDSTLITLDSTLITLDSI